MAVSEPVSQPRDDYDGPFIDLDDALDAFDAELDRHLVIPADGIHARSKEVKLTAWPTER